MTTNFTEFLVKVKNEKSRLQAAQIKHEYLFDQGGFSNLQDTLNQSLSQESHHQYTLIWLLDVCEYALKEIDQAPIWTVLIEAFNQHWNLPDHFESDVGSVILLKVVKCQERIFQATPTGEALVFLDQQIDWIQAQISQSPERFSMGDKKKADWHAILGKRHEQHGDYPAALSEYELSQTMGRSQTNSIKRMNRLIAESAQSKPTDSPASGNGDART